MRSLLYLTIVVARYTEVFSNPHSYAPRLVCFLRKPHQLLLMNFRPFVRKRSRGVFPRVHFTPFGEKQVFGGGSCPFRILIVRLGLV